MTWLVWRQQRLQFYIGVGILAALTVLLLITGVQMANQYHSALAACRADNSCGTLDSLFLGSHAVGFLVILTEGVPAVLGLLLGAPLIAYELEAGTSQFGWTQSVTRKRWFAVKTGWILLATAVCAGAVTALVTWWSGPNNALQLNQFLPNRFDIQGIVPIGYALFAVALGIAAGVLFRRTLPAVAVTLGGFVAVRLLVTFLLRPHYMTPVTATYNLARSFTPTGPAWVISSGIVGAGVPYRGNGPAADVIGNSVIALPPACQGTANHGQGQLMACLGAHGYRAFVTYQPASRFWAFQSIETGIFVVLAAALIALAAFVLLRRDA
jgi:ABC-type transport system involved in multi-copper enzyme maturation permease subunit